VNVKKSTNPIDLAAQFVAGVLARMGVDATVSPETAAEPDRLQLRVTGALGALTGQREFWISLGMLAGQNASRGQTQRYRVYLEAGEPGAAGSVAPPAPAAQSVAPPPSQNGARTARAAGTDPEAFLTDLAAEIAAVVRQTGRRAVLERLGNTERRVVHTALADVEGIRTRSEGSELNRHLLVEPVR
jgi:predicted RNA-binding protein Jag